jgi:hypothetical protein
VEHDYHVTCKKNITDHMYILCMKLYGELIVSIYVMVNGKVKFVGSIFVLSIDMG